MNQTRCDYVHEDGSVLGRPCNELAEWEFTSQVADEDDEEHFMVCSKHLADMLETDVTYTLRSL